MILDFDFKFGYQVERVHSAHSGGGVVGQRDNTHDRIVSVVVVGGRGFCRSLSRIRRHSQ